MNRALLEGNAGRILVLLLPALVYANSLGNPFHYDDYHSIVDNVHIRSLANLPTFFVDPGTFSSEPQNAMYRPLLLASYAVNYAISGQEVWSYHLLGLTMHMASAYLVMLIGIQLLSHRTGAVVAALIFAVHPVNSESINYISSRSELAAGFCILLAVWGFLRWPPTPRLPLAGWLVVTGGFAAGLLSKSVTVVLPGILLAYEVIVERRRRPADWRLYGVLAVVAAVYLSIVGRFLHKAVAGDPVRPHAEQFFSQIKGMVLYLKLMLWPSGLNVDHQFQLSDSAIAPFDAAAASAGLFCLSVLYLHWFHRRTHPVLGFLFCVAILVLLPTSLVPLNVLVNEHRLYVPTAAFALVLAYAGSRIAAGNRALYRPAMAAVAACIVLALGASTMARNRVWASEYSLWSDAAAKAPLMARPHYYLGEALATKGEAEGAIGSFERAIERDPSFGSAYGRFGELLLEQGQPRAALRWLARGTAVEPANPALWSLLGECHRALALGEVGNSSVSFWNEGLTAFRRALELAPEDDGLYNNVGIILQHLGRPSEALAHHSRALALNPKDARTHVNIGAAHWEIGNLELAATALAMAVEIDADNAMAWNNLGTVQERLGQNALAATAFARAASLDPAYARTVEGMPRPPDGD